MKLFPSKTITKTFDFKPGEVSEILQRERFYLSSYNYEIAGREIEGQDIICTFRAKKENIFHRNCMPLELNIRIADESGKAKVSANFQFNKFPWHIMLVLIILIQVLFAIVWLSDSNGDSILLIFVPLVFMVFLYGILRLVFITEVGRLWNDINWVLEEKYNITKEKC